MLGSDQHSGIRRNAADDADRFSPKVMLLVAQGLRSLIAAKKRDHSGHFSYGYDVRSLERSLDDGGFIGDEGVLISVIEPVADLEGAAER